MTVLNLQVSAGADDGYSTGSSSFNNSATAMFSGMTFPNNRHVFARFTGTSGLQDATINAATFSVYRFNRSGSPNAVIYADKSASPTAPTNAANHAGKTRTTAGVSWSVSGGSNNNWHDSPSITTVIQELVDAFTPTAIQILFDDVSVSNSQIGMATYDYNPTLAAKLTIDYSPPNTAPAITVNPSVNYNGYTRTGPNNSPISVGFTATDAEQTGSNALSYQIRTASGAGGTLVASGNFTSGTPASVNIAHNASGINEGSNTLWLRVYDGSEYAPTNPSFTLLVDRTQPTVGTITHSPNPVTP